MRGILAPFIFVFLIAYAFNPAVKKLETWHVPRTGGAFCMILCVYFFITLFFLTVVPLLRIQLTLLMAHFPEYSERFLKILQPLIEKNEEICLHLRDAATGSVQDILNWGLQFVLTIFTSGLALANLLSILVVFYLLKDWDALLHHVDRLVPVCAQRVFFSRNFG